VEYRICIVDSLTRSVRWAISRSPISTTTLLTSRTQVSLGHTSISVLFVFAIRVFSDWSDDALIARDPFLVVCVDRLQPVKDTREKQIQLWKELILKYCKYRKCFLIDLEEEFPLFENTSIQSEDASGAQVSSRCSMRF